MLHRHTAGMKPADPTLAILYEHAAWMEPLFAALDRRGVRYARTLLPGLTYDVSAPTPPAATVFNRISQSAPSRQGREEHGVFFVETLLRRWREAGADLINDAAAFRIDRDKAEQLALIRRLGFEAPATRVIHRPQDAAHAADGLRFPVLVKANIGGGGAGISAYDTPAALADAVAAGQLVLGVDGVGLVQERAPLRGGVVTRIETLGGRFLYAVDVRPQDAASFDLCPADACLIDGGPTFTLAEPPPEWIAAAEAIVQAAGIDVGGVELLVDDRDGRPYVFDVNALSNFVLDAPNVIGFDPYEPLVDMLVARLAKTARAEA